MITSISPSLAEFHLSLHQVPKVLAATHYPVTKMLNPKRHEKWMFIHNKYPLGLPMAMRVANICVQRISFVSA